MEGPGPAWDGAITAELAEVDRQRQLRRARLRAGLAPAPLLSRFVDGVDLGWRGTVNALWMAWKSLLELLTDSTELHLASWQLGDASLALEGQDLEGQDLA